MAGGVVGLPPLATLGRPTTLVHSAHSLRSRTARHVAPCTLHDTPEVLSEVAGVTTLASALDATDAVSLSPALAFPDSAEALTLPLDPPSFLERFWESYLTLLEEKPILVKSLTSLFGFLIGDICAQLIVGADYDIYRTLRMTLFGILMDGPIGHCWYLFLDQNVMPEAPREPKAIVMKTLLDQLIWAPFFSCVFFSFNQTLQGHPELSWPTIQSTLVPTLTANYALWPLAHLINFKFIPSNQRILYINFVQVLWTSYLSNLATKHGRVAHEVQKHVTHPVANQLVQGIRHHLLHHGHHHTDFFHTHIHRFFA